MRRRVVIDWFTEGVSRRPPDSAIVAVDVIRATTTAVTAVALGWRCFPVPSIEFAAGLARRLERSLLIGELGGYTPYGFEFNNSPAELAARDDVDRPLILLSTSGTRLLCSGADGQPMYAACLRNFRSTAEHVSDHHHTVVVVGAGARGEIREEDELCCAWVARALVAAGYESGDDATEQAVARWRDGRIDAITEGRSADYLRRTGQQQDLDFVLDHVDDLDIVVRAERGELVVVGSDMAALSSGVP